MLNVKITANDLASLIIKEYACHSVYLDKSHKKFIRLCVQNVDFDVKNLQLFLDYFFHTYLILTLNDLKECLYLGNELEIVFQNHKYALVC